MRIEKLFIDKSITSKEGIEEINLERLGPVVALIGKNGSGKSRILKLIQNYYVKNFSIKDAIDESIKYLPNALTNYFNKFKPDVSEILYLDYQISELSKAVTKKSDEKLLKKLENLKTQRNLVLQNTLNLHNSYSAFNDQAHQFNAVIKSTIPKYFYKINHTEIQQLKAGIDNASSKILFENLIENVSEEDDYNEVTSLYNTALTYLSTLPHKLVFDLDDCYGNEKKFNEKISYKRYISLKKLIKIFLNKDLEFKKEITNLSFTQSGGTSNFKGKWVLNERPFNYGELSEGEKTLFAYSLLLFLLDQNPNVRIKESIILIDEPELHLHPESKVALLRGLKNIVNDRGQLWIATHSINILADLSYDEIFMVKDNNIISPSRTTPGKTFVELMGLDEHAEMLSQFVTNISNWAFVNFMNQCFNNPDVIESARSNDPEIELFKKSLKANTKGNILLDFGAGKGRVLNEIISDEILKDKLECFALEPNEENAKELEKLKINKVYKTYEELPNNKFNYVLLCNVLHEIPILKWELILNKINESLKEEGFIIIIEDKRLPKGEMIGEEGFLVMDIQSIKELFKMEKEPSQLVSIDEKYKDRILCVVISKTHIKKIDKNSILKSMHILQENTYKEIKNNRKIIKTKENELVLGREAAFLSQLYINSKLAEEKLNQ